ncbi:unnamed protein product [Ixodes hexagonus]
MYTIGAVADLIGKQCIPSEKAGKTSSKSKKHASEAKPRTPLYTEHKLESPTPPTKRSRESEKPDDVLSSSERPSAKRVKRKKLKKPKVKEEPKLEFSEDDFEQDTSEESAAEEDYTTPEEPPPRKRKKQKLSSKVLVEAKEPEAGDDVFDPEEVKPPKNITPESPEKEARTIFVGNLPVIATEKPLRRHFNQYGAIESVRFRSVAPARASLSKKVAYISKSIHNSKQNVNAYVVFKQKESVAKALAANGSLLLGNHVRVDRVGKKPQVDDRKSVFVGNLPHEVQDEELWNCFSECGQVTGVRVIRDRETGMGKGFGFVTFSKLDAAALALEMSGIQMSGRPIRVTPVSKQQGVAKKGPQGPQQTGYARRKAKSKAAPEESTDFTGARAERLLKKKKLKKVIRLKKQQKQQKAVFGFGGGKSVVPKKEKKRKKSGAGAD